MTYWSQEIILQLFLSLLSSMVHNSRWKIWATCIIFLEWKPTILMAVCICLRQNTSLTRYFAHNFKMQNLLILLFLPEGSLVVIMMIPCLMPQCIIALLVLFSTSPLPVQIFHLSWTKYASSRINPLAPIGWLSNVYYVIWRKPQLMVCSTNLVLFLFKDSRMQIMVVIQMTDIQLVIIVSSWWLSHFLEC